MAKHRLRSELPLILASVFIAFVIWLIAKQTDMDADWLTAPVVLQNVPSYMMVEALPTKVSINVQYPKELNNKIVEKNFSIPIDVSEVFDEMPGQWDQPTAAKEVPFTLRPMNVKSSSLPPTVQAVGLSPREVRLKARLRTLLVNVKVETTGTLPANLTFTAPPRPEPSQLLVTGSPDALAKLASQNNNIATEPVDLSTLKGSSQVFPRVRLPDSQLILLSRHDDRVTVNIGLSERPVRLTISQVPVSIATFSENLKAKINPPTVDVILEGPSSALKNITAGDLVFTPTKELVEQTGHVSEVGLEGRLKNTVPAPIAQQISVVEVHPSRISVEFVPLDKQNKAEGPRAGTLR